MVWIEDGTVCLKGVWDLDAKREIINNVMYVEYYVRKHPITIDQLSDAFSVVDENDSGYLCIRSDGSPKSTYVAIWWKRYSLEKKFIAIIGRMYFSKNTDRFIVDLNCEALQQIFKDPTIDLQRFVLRSNSILVDIGVEYPPNTSHILKVSKRLRLAIVKSGYDFYLCTPVGYIRLYWYYSKDSFADVLKRIGINYNITSKTKWEDLEHIVIHKILGEVYK